MSPSFGSVNELKSRFLIGHKDAILQRNDTLCDLKMDSDFDRGVCFFPVFFANNFIFSLPGMRQICVSILF